MAKFGASISEAKFLGRPPDNLFYVMSLTDANANDCCKLHFNNLQVELMVLFSFMPKYIENVVFADNTEGAMLSLVDSYFYLSLLREINDSILSDFQIMIKILLKHMSPSIKDHSWARWPPCINISMYCFVLLYYKVTNIN